MSERAQNQLKQSSPASFTPVSSGVLQRQCACGNHTVAGGECAECGKKKQTLQRAPFSPRGRGMEGEGEVPPIVHEVLRSPGQPLDPETRAFMEPRFGHDFSQVRVHADAKAAESAQAVNALAYTVGHNIMFGAGQYASGTTAGRRLLAHELTHVVQQRATPSPSGGISTLGDPHEHEADRIASAVIAAQEVSVNASAAAPFLQRQEAFKLRPPLSSPPSRRRPGLFPPGEELELQLRINYARHELSGEEKQTITKLPNVEKPAGPALTGFREGPWFVLHDTADVSDPKEFKKIETNLKKKPVRRGPLGVGYPVNVLTADPPVRRRAAFFEANRPTATEYEKGEDILHVGDREKALRKVWQATDETQRTNAIKHVRAEFSVTVEDEREDKQDPEKEFKAPCNPTPDKPCIHTIGQWSVDFICKQPRGDIKSQAASGKKPEEVARLKDLESGCAALKPVFDAREKRIPASVNAELVQLTGCPPGKKCDDCHPGKNPVRLPRPAYTENQYKSVKNLYLEAAVQAGVFPYITTHFWVDAKVHGHCDPRCFDLGHLYEWISADLNHKKEDIYGLEPRYGISGTDNVWWHPVVCGEKPRRA